MTHVLRTMERDLAEQVTIDDLASTALLSKFHFSRTFKTTTGISPGRFLYAMRMQAAKRYLRGTRLSILEISNLVGYRSVGSFSSRFTMSVGIPPSAYRDRTLLRPEFWTQAARSGGKRATIRGTVATGHRRAPGAFLVGIFPSPMVEGRPISGAITDMQGRFVLHNVPGGTWYLLAYPAAADHTTLVGTPGPPMGTVGPITLRPVARLWTADVELRSRSAFEPPVLLAPTALSPRYGAEYG